MHIRCWSELAQYGALDVLNREYGGLLAPQTEPEYNVSLEIDLNQAPPEGGELSHTPEILISSSYERIFIQRSVMLSSNLLHF